MAFPADAQCNGSIYLVGGSGGGTLALWCALDPAAGAVSGWNETARSHIKAVVSLSGPTELCDWRSLGPIPQDAVTRFENDLDNYVGLMPQTDCLNDPNQNLAHASPEWLVTNGATSNPPPVMLYATDGDPVPYVQADDMYNALTTQFPNVVVNEYVMDYLYTDQTNHAYKYWHALNTLTGNCVSSEVIAFLQSH